MCFRLLCVFRCLVVYSADSAEDAGDLSSFKIKFVVV
jgi:hypothetical protein